MKQTTEFSLRLFIWKARWILKKTFDAAEELRNLNKNNGAGKSESNKKRARKSFGMGYGDTKSSEQTGSGTIAWTRAKISSWAIISTAVNKSKTKQQQQQQHSITKKELHRCSRRKKRHSPTKVNWEIPWQIFPIIVWNISISITRRLLLIVLCTYFSTWIRFFLNKNLTTNTVKNV